MSGSFNVDLEFGLCFDADMCVMDRECMNYDNCLVTQEEMANGDSD